MYIKTQVIECLKGLVGFRQTDNPDYPQLGPSLLVSESGLFFQDEHPLLNIENIDQALKNYAKYNFPEWQVAVEYSIGQRVYEGTVVYESLINNNTGNQPSASPGQWVVVDLFSQKLQALVESSINKMLLKVTTKKKLRENTKSILDNVYLFDGVGRLADKELKQNRFVGISFKVMTENDLRAIIKRIGLQFTEANADFNLYLFHSSQSNPIKVFTYQVAGNSSFQWFAEENFALPYNAETLDSGGIYILGYYEEDLTGQAINKRYYWDRAPNCATCNKDHYYYENWSQYFDFGPVSVGAQFLEGIKPSDGAAKLFDVDKMAYYDSSNFGINMQVTANCDLTDFICRNRELFTDPLIKQVTVDLLEEIAYSSRHNQISKETRTLAMYALNGDKDNYGQKKELAYVIKGLDFDMSDLNSVCAPCQDKWAPSWKQI